MPRDNSKSQSEEVKTGERRKHLIMKAAVLHFIPERWVSRYWRKLLKNNKNDGTFAQFSIPRSSSMQEFHASAEWLHPC